MRWEAIFRRLETPILVEALLLPQTTPILVEALLLPQTTPILVEALLLPQTTPIQWKEADNIRVRKRYSLRKLAYAVYVEALLLSGG